MAGYGNASEGNAEIAEGSKKMGGLGRLELPTSPLSGVRSSHLSYRPNLLQGISYAICGVRQITVVRALRSWRGLFDRGAPATNCNRARNGETYPQGNHKKTAILHSDF